MKKSVVLTVALVSAGLALAAGIAAVWPDDHLQGVALMILPVTLVASLLVLFFDWRSRLRRRDTVASRVPASSGHASGQGCDDSTAAANHWFNERAPYGGRGEQRYG